LILLENVSIRAGEFSLENVSMEVPSRKYGVLMGKTGSGKTSILESIIGLRSVSGGRIWLCGDDMTQMKPALRGIGYVPQDGAIFSTMTVRDQIALALYVRRAKPAVIRRRVAELADMLGIAELLDRMPKGLSGGERQRVALGRALSFQPRVLCLDEPLSALDEETRQQMYLLLERVREETGVTALHVTHSSEEAERLADCVFRVESGRVEPVDVG
jgi:molybdate/tungstate transport system ATP-binding protein